MTQTTIPNPIQLRRICRHEAQARSGVLYKALRPGEELFVRSPTKQDKDRVPP